MSEFEGLRRELGIEGQKERKQRLKALKKERKSAYRTAKKVLKKLRDEVFHEADVRRLDSDTLGIAYKIPRELHRRRKDKWQYEILVRVLLNDNYRPTGVRAFECWREFGDNVPLGATASSEHPPSITVDPTQHKLVEALKTLLYRYPPER